jgi:hypothetical protein
MVKKEKRVEREVECDHFHSPHVRSTYPDVFISPDNFLLIEGQAVQQPTEQTSQYFFVIDTLNDEGSTFVRLRTKQFYRAQADGR